jgi:hypothetical protein
MTTPEQMQPQKVMDCISLWLRTAEAGGRGLAQSADQFTINMRKSALLKRLLSGKKPFPFPPPKSFAYPNYSLLEEGFAEGWMDVSTPTEGEVLINQDLWSLVEVRGERHWFVSYNTREGSVWELSPLAFDKIVEVHGKHNPHRTVEQVLQDCKDHVEKYFRLACIVEGKNSPNHILLRGEPHESS